MANQRRRRRNPFRYARRKKLVSYSTSKVAKTGQASKVDLSNMARDIKKFSLEASLARWAKPELKFMDTELYNSTLPTSGWSAVNSIDSIPQGDSAGSRDGDVVIMKKIQVKGYITINAGASYPTLVRLVIFKRPINDTSPTTTDYADAVINSFRNLHHSVEYQTLYDKVHELQVLGVSANSTWNFDINIPVDYPVHYVSSGTAAPERNAVYLMLMQSDATYAPTAYILGRIRYYDK